MALVFLWLSVKAKTRDCLGSRGLEKFVELRLNQNFLPTTPKGREPRCQMAEWPLTGAGVFISLVNGMLILNAHKIVVSRVLSKKFPACRIGGAC